MPATAGDHGAEGGPVLRADQLPVEVRHQRCFLERARGRRLVDVRLEDQCHGLGGVTVEEEARVTQRVDERAAPERAAPVAERRLAARLVRVEHEAAAAEREQPDPLPRRRSNPPAAAVSTNVGWIGYPPERVVGAQRASCQMASARSTRVGVGVKLRRVTASHALGGRK